MSSSSLNFVINQPPRNGSCSISPENGTTLTVFTVSCPSWFDEDGIQDYSLFLRSSSTFVSRRSSYLQYFHLLLRLLRWISLLCLSTRNNWTINPPCESILVNFSSIFGSMFSFGFGVEFSRSTHFSRRSADHRHFASSMCHEHRHGQIISRERRKGEFSVV